MNEFTQSAMVRMSRPVWEHMTQVNLIGPILLLTMLDDLGRGLCKL
jgi:hypothetical protein